MTVQRFEYRVSALWEPQFNGGYFSHSVAQDATLAVGLVEESQAGSASPPNTVDPVTKFPGYAEIASREVKLFPGAQPALATYASISERRGGVERSSSRLSVLSVRIPFQTRTSGDGVVYLLGRVCSRPEDFDGVIEELSSILASVELA